jgi:hypothetical protein
VNGLTVVIPSRNAANLDACVASVLQNDACDVYEIQAIENVQQRNLVMILTCLEIDNAKVGS